MSNETKDVFEFGPFRLDPSERLFLDNGKAITLTPKVFDLLVLFAENPGRLLEKEWLLKRLWPETFVEEANLSVNVSTLRRAMGASGNLIETVPKRGYRFVGEVRKTVASPPRNASITVLGEGLTETGSGADFPPASGLSGPPRLTSSTPDRPQQRHGLLRPMLITAGVLALLGGGYLLGGRDWFRSIQNLSEIHSLAVLPFRPLAGDAGGGDYLGPGIADALVRQMSTVQQITVRPTAAVQKYFGSSVDPIKAGRELGVDVVLDGNVQRSEKMVRVSVQLLRVADGAPLWAEHFDDYFTNIFQVQDSISEKVASALSMKLSPKEHSRMAKRQTENTEAYELYLQGKYLELKRTPDAPAEKSIDLYQQAIAKDPDYALAYAGLATIYMEVAGMEGNRDATVKAKAAASRALALDNELPEAHLAQGHVMLRGEWDWAGARREFDQALALDPHLAYAHWSKSLILMALGETEPALEEMKMARRLDPGSQNTMDDLGWAYDCNRKWADSIRESKAAVAMGPESIAAHHQLGRAYLHAKQYPNAENEFETTLRLDETKRGLADLGALAAARGDVPKARAVLNELLQAERKSPTYEFAYMRAVLESSLGEKDAAFQSLETAVSRKLSRAIWMRVDPDLDRLRGDPRMDSLLRRIRLLQ